MSIVMADYPIDLEIDLTAKATVLVDLLAECRPDMHEPDEQQMLAVFTGCDFDNAGTCDEMRVNLIRGRDESRKDVSINLCNLLAIVRYLYTSREHYHNLYTRLQDQVRKAKAQLG